MNSHLLEQAKHGDPDAKEQMILENLGLIWGIVHRFAGRGVDTEDLFQLGCIGLLKAIDGYNSEFGTQFSTYAVPKIAGEIRRFLRDDGIIKVSRTLKEQAALIKRVSGELCARLGREPFLSELCDATGLTADEIAMAETAAAQTDSLQRQICDEDFCLEQILPGADLEESVIETMALWDAIAALEPRQQAVLNMRFFRGMTQEKTALVLGISQVQVSRIERKALTQLRDILLDA